MNDYRIVTSIEPNDKYQKAKKDLFTAKKSFDALDDYQKKQLVNELFGAANAEYILSHFFKQ